MLKKPAELTFDGIRNIFEKDKVSGIVQILSIEENKPNVYRVTISDGHSKYTAVFCDEAGKKIHEIEKKLLHSIIELKEGFVQRTKEKEGDHKLIFIRKFDSLIEDLTILIGDPIDFSIYKQQNFQNSKGSNQIHSDLPLKSSVEQPKKKSQAILISNNEPTENFMTLNMLSMMSENWRIKARILKKSEKRTWKSVKGEGVVFSIDIVDCNGTEMNCSFFNTSCDKWSELLEAGKTYVFSGGNVKMNNSKFNQKNDYQIIFDEKTDIQIVDEDSTMIKQKFNFVKINKINELPVGTMIDVIGIVKEPGVCQEVPVKNAPQPKSRKIIQIYDDSSANVEMTLWGDNAHQDLQKNSIILIKNARCSEFNTTRNLSSTFQTLMTLDEKNEDYQRLEQWRKSLSTEEIEQINIKERTEKRRRFKSLAQIEAEANLISDPTGEKIFSDTRAYLLHIKFDERSPLFYLACQNEKCSKKVIEDMDGWRCETCNKTYKEPLAKYILSARIADDTQMLWVNLFDTVGNMIIGKTANEMREMKDQGQNELILSLIKATSFKQVKVRIMSRIDNYNGESRVKHQVVKLFGKDSQYDTKVISDEIDEYLAQGNDKNLF